MPKNIARLNPFEWWLCNWMSHPSSLRPWGPGSRQRLDPEGNGVLILWERFLASEPSDVRGEGHRLHDFVSFSDVAGAVLAALAI